MFEFTPLQIPPKTNELRAAIRAFIDQYLEGFPAEQKARSWIGFDADFSHRLGNQGWIGMTWPKQYGGHEQSFIDRYTVIEELLAAGAPVGAHWIADRQSGALLLRYGSEAIKQRYLSQIANGECFFCIGMSEPNAGSDLASIRTRATRVEGGWQINGAKLWTTHVHRCHMMIALVRTSPLDNNNRHAGLSQFLVDLSAPGITINPILDQTGDLHFGEVFFENVFVADEMLLGKEGEGWRQVTEELSLERSGPERYLSSYRLLEELVSALDGEASDLTTQLVGSLVAELWTLRQMSMSVTGQLERGEDPALGAAIVKDLGASFEQNLPFRIQTALDDELPHDKRTVIEEVLMYLLKASPSFSLRGGTREILRGIIARGLGLR